MLEIRRAVAEDFAQICPIFHEIVAAGTTYTIDRDTDEAGARRIMDGGTAGNLGRR